MADAKVIGPIERGAIVVLLGIWFEEPDQVAQVGKIIEEVSGHSEFGLIWFGGDDADGTDVEVWSPDTDVRARLAELLDARAG